LRKTNLQHDSALVSKAARGDHSAFMALVQRHQAMVSGVTLSVLRDFSASEDAAQETFLTAWQKLGSLQDPSKLRPWLASIARNTARNTALSHLRMKKRKAEIHERAEGPEGSAVGPDEMMARKDELSLVLAALETLPEKYRTPLILFYREDQSVAAVAEALGLSKNAVKQRLKRGRAKLHREVETTLGKTLLRSAPTVTFTASVAAGLASLAPPAASAATGFSISAVTTSGSGSSPLGRLL
jgi:RNA polymerase sigma factor (sigma-70 family)